VGEAIAELRAVRRMSGGNAHLAVLADCERPLPAERAIDLIAEAGSDVSPAVAVELRIVSAVRAANMAS